MLGNDLADVYRAYLDCLNRQDWPKLGTFVGGDVSHNGRQLGVAGYRAMLEGDFRDIPDLRFNIELLVVDPPFVAARLRFDCAPAGTFLGLPVNGKRISFSESVFYRFGEGKIRHVWSVLDKVAVEAQL